MIHALVFFRGLSAVSQGRLQIRCSLQRAAPGSATPNWHSPMCAHLWFLPGLLCFFSCLFFHLVLFFFFLFFFFSGFVFFFTQVCFVFIFGLSWTIVCMRMYVSGVVVLSSFYHTLYKYIYLICIKEIYNFCM